MAFRPGFHSVAFVLILVSFVFLLLATISPPVVSTFALSKTSDYVYGIFGFCTNSGSKCSTATFPYSLSDVDDKTDNWLLANSSRDNLAKVFIIAPISLGVNFILLALIVAAHFTAKTVTIFAIILNFISFIVTTLVAVIIVVVFYPNVAWTGWILIGAAAANLISIVFLALAATIGSDDNDVDDLDSAENNLTNFTVLENKFNNVSSYGNTSNLAGGFKGPTTSYSANNTFDTSSIEKDYDFKQQQATAVDTTKPFQPYANTLSSINKTVSNNSLYNTKPQTVNDFTTKQASINGSAYSEGSQVGSKASLNNSSGNRQPRVNGAPYPQSAQPDKYSSVFEHHPEVEGHKPFTELDDYDNFDDDDAVPLNRNTPPGSNDSDVDSDFTSVSQRAVNPNYNNYYGQPAPQQPQQSGNGYYAMTPQGPSGQYPHVQQYQPHYQQQSPPQPGPGGYFGGSNGPGAYSRLGQPVPLQRSTVSDNVLNANPDFNLVGPRRRMQPGFVPVAARYNANKSAAASSLMGRGGAPGSGGAPRHAASGPYGGSIP